MSAEPSGLYIALLAVKAEVRTLPKDATNPHYRSKYTPLDTIVEQVEPILTKHGLVWITKPIRDEHGDPALAYRLVHAATKEFEEGEMPLLLTKSDPQGQGSAITYARRYAMCSVLNLVADADDDGEAARGAARADEPKQEGRKGLASEKQTSTIFKIASQKKLTTGQLRQMVTEVGGSVEAEEPREWITGLTGGKEGQASAMIDRLINGEIPAAAPVPSTPPSDVPSDAGEFTHEPQPSLEDVVLEKDAA